MTPTIWNQPQDFLHSLCCGDMFVLMKQACKHLNKINKTHHNQRTRSSTSRLGMKYAESQNILRNQFQMTQRCKHCSWCRFVAKDAICGTMLEDKQILLPFCLFFAQLKLLLKLIDQSNVMGDAGARVHTRAVFAFCEDVTFSVPMFKTKLISLGAHAGPFSSTGTGVVLTPQSIRVLT